MNTHKRFTVLLIIMACFAQAGDFTGTWEGTKLNGRSGEIEPWGPVKIESVGHGQFKLTHVGSMFGLKDWELGEAKMDHSKLRVTRPGMKIELEMDHGTIRGAMHHHGMKETFSLKPLGHESPESIYHALKKDPKSASLPTQSQFLAILHDTNLHVAEEILRIAHHRDPHHPIFAASVVNRIGYEHLNKGRGALALKYFKLNVMANADDPNSYDSLGEAFVKLGKRDEAIHALKKSLSMDPPERVRENSLKLLRQLGVKNGHGHHLH